MFRKLNFSFSVIFISIFLLLPVSVSAQTILWTKQKEARFETGNFSEFTDTSVYNGNIYVRTDSSKAFEGSRFMEAALTGFGENAYARGQWTVGWYEGYIYKTEAALFLPSGFYQSMKGAIQFIGWDTYPILHNQMRLIVYVNDKKARLFLKSEGVDKEITNTFSIPENQWVKIIIEQKLSNTNGWSKVYMNGSLVAQGTGDTLTPYQVTRIRYGFVADGGALQNVPINLFMDAISLYSGSINSVTVTNTPKPLATSTPTLTIKVGDANGDGKVDGLDYIIWLTNYGKVATLGHIQGDFNKDTKVDGLDYVIWLTGYGK